MIKYWYKQKCDECPTCNECSNIGYTDSFVWDKEDIPDNAYDIAVLNNDDEIVEVIENKIDFLETRWG